MDQVEVFVPAEVVVGVVRVMNRGSFPFSAKSQKASHFQLLKMLSPPPAPPPRAVRCRPTARIRVFSRPGV